MSFGNAALPIGTSSINCVDRSRKKRNRQADIRKKDDKDREDWLKGYDLVFEPREQCRSSYRQQGSSNDIKA